MKILLCDDSKSVHAMFKSMMADTGHTVLDAFDAVDLVAHLENQCDVSAVLLDWEMPDVNGIEALRLLRNSGFILPIIMLTGKNSEANIQEALADGATAYIMKPFTRDLVLSALSPFS